MGRVETNLSIRTVQEIQDWLTQSWIYKEQHLQYREDLAAIIKFLWPAAKSPENKNRKPSYFPLPSLCAHALGGGYSETTTAVNAAWVLLYMASYLMDKIEDQETYQPIFSRFSFGAVASLASGLFFHAERILAERQPDGMVNANTLDAIRREFNLQALEVCAGQHLDLTIAEPSLDQIWKIVNAKSGRFFALGAYLGVRLATDNVETLERFSHIGQNLGVLVQIRNDVQGLGYKDQTGSDLAYGKHTLPIQYALQVLPADESARLVELLLAAPKDPPAEIQARKMIISAGAVVYLSLEANKRLRQAVSVIDQTGLDAELLHPLRELLDYAGSIKLNSKRF